MHVSETLAHPFLVRHSHWSWARWGSPVFGWGLVAAGRFFAGGWVSSAPCEDAGPVVDVAGSAVL